jgi:uncharacterized RDD family membrane protein YckC
LSAPGAPRAGLARRFASAFYDALLLAALLLVATLPFVLVVGDATQGWRRHLLQAWLVVVAGLYFVYFWTRGQTLAMRTWRLRVVRSDGAPVSPVRAAHRYALAVVGSAALGATFLWALVDRERLFLHDRLAGTAIVDVRRET